MHGSTETRQICNETTDDAAELTMFWRVSPVVALLWLPYGIGQTIIFLPCGFFFLLLSFFPRLCFFPRLISAAGDWMSAILPHMVWP